MTETQKIAAIPTGSRLTLYGPATPVGYWCLYEPQAFSTRITIYQKPTDEQIANTEKLLGWKWKDAE